MIETINPTLTKRYGPYPSVEEALGVKEIKSTHSRNVFSINYTEDVVDIDPILEALVTQIAAKVSSWADDNLIQKKKNRPIYIHENVVRRSLKTLSDEIQQMLITNLESPNASVQTD